MTSSKFATEGGTSNSELPELQRPEHGNGVEEEDDEGFQTVVSKRTVKLLQQQQQQQYQNRQNNRRGYHNGNGYGHHHSYGNGNGRHYHRQYGPPHSSSSGANSNSSASSIPEELPKDKDHIRNDENQTADSPTPPRPQPITIPPTTATPAMAWARIAAGEKPPKLDVPQSPGSTDTCHSPVSSTSSSTFDVKPLAISLVTTSACEGNSSDEATPIVKTCLGKTNSVPQPNAQQEDQQSQDPTSQRPQQPQILLPPPPPSVSVWKLRAAAHSGGQTKSDVAQSAAAVNTANAMVAGTTKGKLPPIMDWPSLDDAVKPPPAKAEAKLVSFTPQTGGTSPSESATDSGNEEILRITGPPELSDEKWPLPLVSNGIGKGHGQDPNLALIEKLRQSRHSSGDAMSSSGCDLAGNGEGGDDEGPGSSTDTKKKRKNKKASKPKWVPLILEDEPPKPPSKPKKRPSRDKFVERGSQPQQQQQHNGDSQGGATGGEASSECATPTDGLPRGKSGPGRGGRNGHKGKGHRNYHGYYKFYKETSDPSQTPDANGDVYTEYPPEFTTLNPMYPMTEFVMPYANYATYSPPPDAQSYTYAPIQMDDAVLSQLIQKQIEYYFSEENLERDFYLRRKMDSDGFIPISLISSFYRIQSLTQDYGVVLNAIKASELIEVKEEEESCAFARPVADPTKWPIVDTAAASIPPPPAIVKSFLTTVVATPTQ